MKRGDRANDHAGSHFRVEPMKYFSENKQPRALQWERDKNRIFRYYVFPALREPPKVRSGAKMVGANHGSGLSSGEDSKTVLVQACQGLHLPQPLSGSGV